MNYKSFQHIQTDSNSFIELSQEELEYLRALNERHQERWEIRHHLRPSNNAYKQFLRSKLLASKRRREAEKERQKEKNGETELLEGKEREQSETSSSKRRENEDQIAGDPQKEHNHAYTVGTEGMKGRSPKRSSVRENGDDGDDEEEDGEEGDLTPTTPSAGGEDIPWQRENERRLMSERMRQRRRVVIPFQPSSSEIHHTWYSSDVFVQYTFVLQTSNSPSHSILPTMRYRVTGAKRTRERKPADIPGYIVFSGKRVRREEKESGERILPYEMRKRVWVERMSNE